MYNRDIPTAEKYKLFHVDGHTGSYVYNGTPIIWTRNGDSISIVSKASMRTISVNDTAITLAKKYMEVRLETIRYIKRQIANKRKGETNVRGITI